MSSPVSLSGIVPEMRPTDLGAPTRVHIVGIGGAGMRAIARVLVAQGHTVSGSDRADSAHVAALRELGVAVTVGHDVAAVAAVDLVTRSTAVPDDDPEIAAAMAAGVAVRYRAEVLAAISAVQASVLVAGTHGKTTTSSMLAVILDVAGRDPSFIIGSEVARFGTGARWRSDSIMVIEADESDGTFLALAGAHAIVTSLDPDHLEYYGGQERLDAAFVRFVEGIAGVTAVCVDDPDTGPLLGLDGVVTYGTDPSADLVIVDLGSDGHQGQARFAWRGRDLGPVRIGLPGHHNTLNAAGASAIALELGVDPAQVLAGLEAFGGVARRFESRGSAAGVTFIDDYAHLPAEVEAAISAARSGDWNRVVVAYQPHRYSRTQALGHTFAGSFRGVDHLVLTGIYPSGEQPRPGVTGRIVHDAVVDACPTLDVTYRETLAEVRTHLGDMLAPGDLCLTLGAGDLTTVPDQVRGDLLRSWADDLDATLGGSRLLLDEPLGPRTTYRVGGRAQTLIEVATRDDLATVVAAARHIDSPVLVIGRGSNLLVSDRGLDAIVVVLVEDFEQVDIDGTSVTAGGAVPLPALARQTVAAGLAGFEWAVGVPGSIGGAIAMNAGGHGSDMAASVVEATVMHVPSGRLSRRTNSELDFGYRRSSIGADDIVIDTTLSLAPGPADAGRALLSEIVTWRRENQPGGQNAGSVFINPPDDSAGRLIDTAGAKGLRVGSARVSTKHANFIQVDPGGSAEDVYALMGQVADLVRDRTGVQLVPETRLVGFAPFPTSFESATNRGAQS